LKTESSSIELTASLKMTESGGIYDYAWYPHMNSYDSATSCLFATSKSNPIHLFDAYTGQIRCSYRGHNHLDELDNAYSIAFNTDATCLYAGYKKCIRIFDVSRPGKNYNEFKLSSK
jgi:telomerase Cajal body protein 1